MTAGGHATEWASASKAGCAPTCCFVQTMTMHMSDQSSTECNELVWEVMQRARTRRGVVSVRRFILCACMKRMRCCAATDAGHEAGWLAGW